MEKKICNKWSEKEIEILEEMFPYKSNDELVEYFDGRSKSSIIKKAHKLSLKKIEPNVKEGYCVCKQCNRELPWTSQYYPKMKSEKNPRKICRECNPKYGNFLKDDFKERTYWSKEDEELFIKRYPYYTNEELRNKFYNNLTDKQLTNKAYTLGVSHKTDETFWRGRKQQAPKVSAKLKGIPKSDEQKKKLSDIKKKQYAEGVCISPWLGRVVTQEERQRMSERVKGKWAGKNNPRYLSPLLGEENGRWLGGITNISTALRENIYEWKQDSMELCNYKCIFTGGDFDNIHHLIPFNNIVKECLEELNLTTENNLGKYNDIDRSNLIKLIQEKHKIYGLGLCLNKEIHKLFHDEYSYIDFSVDNFKEFITNYFNGKYDNRLNDKLKSVNSIMSYEEANLLASFYYAEN